MSGLRIFTLTLCAGATLLGALLIFAVQPLLAKHLLPWFGGSPSTWSACLVFFQGMLLAGYGYAHALARFLSRGRQLAVHGVAVAIAAVIAWSSGELKAPLGSGEPPLQIALLLGSQIGASYFVLSATGPLVQAWTAPLLRGEPYALYALSNAGSLIALLAYPFVIEPYADVQAQMWGWTYAFGSYAAVLVLAMIGVHRFDRVSPPSHIAARHSNSPPPRLGQIGYWLACSYVPSVLLVAVTSHITTDVAAIPLLWILPLAIYLVTFIAAYSREGNRLRTPALALWVLAASGLGIGAFAQGSASLAQQLAVPCLALFAAGILCHGELARARPSATYLTQYYLVIALGGVLGSISVSWLAPALFDDYYELELSALAVFALLAFKASLTTRAQRSLLYLGLGICGPFLVGSMAVRARDVSAQGTVIERGRGFMGPLRVVDTAEGRLLTHGRIRHGLQLRDPASPAHLLTTPTLYFGEGTAIERVMRGFRLGRWGRRIGIVGLGAGTLASYGQRGDELRFYELDENVVNLAQRHFSFLAQRQTLVEIAIGDGRLLLEREPGQDFAILVLDAFSSDAVPVHLLTREAFALYARHLATGGVLLANVSNRHLAIDRAVCAAASEQGLACRTFETAADPARHRALARWTVMARPTDLVGLENGLLAGLTAVPLHGPPVLFTDARASLWSIVKRD